MRSNNKLIKFISMSMVLIMLCSSFVYAGEVDTVKDNLKGALLGDLETNEILYEYNIDKPLPLASISKLMTYSLLMDKVVEGKIKLDDEITISNNAANTEGSKFGMIEGEKIKVSMMIEALLIISGNDVATAIAEHVAGTEEEFVKMMNDKAKTLGLSSATFINPHGLPEENVQPDQNYMSIKDLYTFVRYLLTTYPQVLETTKKSELVIPERNFSRKSTNPLFGVVDGVDGLKTGYTDEAGICLVSTLPVKAQNQNSEDYRVIAIVMGAQTHPERIEKSKALLDHGRNDYIMQNLSNKDEVSDTIHIGNAKVENVNVYAKEDYSKLIKNGETIRTEKVYNEEIKAPIKEGTKIGELNYYIGNEKIKTVDLEVREDIKKANIFVRIFRFFRNLFK